MTPEEKTVLQTRTNQTNELIEFFKRNADISKLNPADPNYRLAEQFYWIGLVKALKLTGQDLSQFLTDEVVSIMLSGNSPVLSLKPKQVRIRAKKGKEATDGQSNSGPAAAA